MDTGQFEYSVQSIDSENLQTEHLELISKYLWSFRNEEHQRKPKRCERVGKPEQRNRLDQ